MLYIFVGAPITRVSVLHILIASDFLRKNRIQRVHNIIWFSFGLIPWKGILHWLVRL